MQRIRLTEKRYSIVNEIVNGTYKHKYRVPAMTNSTYSAKNIEAVFQLAKGADAFWVSKSFYDAAREAADKLLDKNLLATITDGGSAVFIYGETIMSISCIVDDEAVAFCGVSCIGNLPVHVYYFGYNKETENTEATSSIESEDTSAIRLPVILYLFKQYAPTETVVLPPSKKVEAFKCSYKNDLPTNVNILDCRWFTDLVQNNPFWVRGHLRLQPCGEGLKDRKVIFIDPFVKQGYTLKAGKQDAA